MLGHSGRLDSPRVGNPRKLVKGGVRITVFGKEFVGASFQDVLVQAKRDQGSLDSKKHDAVVRAFCGSYPGHCIRAGKGMHAGLSMGCASCGGGRVR